jgi:hypothetical protein
MKRVILLISGLLMASPVAAVEQRPSPTDQMNNINYSYGYQLGRELLAANVELRPEVLYQALYDALDKSEPELSRDEINNLLERLRGAQ